MMIQVSRPVITGNGEYVGIVSQLRDIVRCREISRRFKWRAFEDSVIRENVVFPLLGPILNKLAHQRHFDFLKLHFGWLGEQLLIRRSL